MNLCQEADDQIKSEVTIVFMNAVQTVMWPPSQKHWLGFQEKEFYVVKQIWLLLICQHELGTNSSF